MALDSSPIVLLTGARQTGKTTLMKAIAGQKGFEYISFDDINFLTSAQRDPMGFLLNIKKPTVIDEVQRVPEIALPIKLEVDNSNQNGMFALTGSANPLAVPKLNDSLAGRMIILNLWPLSQGEILGRQEQFLDSVFSINWIPPTCEKWTQGDMFDRLVIGGYPRMQNLAPIMRREWCNSHLMTILERDAQDISNISRLKELPFLMKLLALRASNLLNIAEVSRTAGIAHSTLTLYLDILEALFLIVRQPAWHSNKGKRLIKMPKMYLTDCGILSYLLGADQETLVGNSLLLGQILENFVVQELRKQATWSTKQVSLFHFRTQAGAEVDLVLEDSLGNIVGIEVKSSVTIRKDDFKGLEALAETAGDNFIRGLVIYQGNSIVPFGKNIFAVPISILWS